MPSRSLLAALSLLLLVSVGCTSSITGGETTTRTGPWWVCPPVKGAGLEHGKKCTQDSECMYGHCIDGGFLAGYVAGIKYCSKNNNCTGGEAAVCSTDGAFASAFEKSVSGGNPKRTSPEPFKVCAKTCKSDADCSAWNIELPDCIKNSTDYISVGTTGVCGVNPFK